MKSNLELELELANAKLAKMTSTVKQLGTKLKVANEDLSNLKLESLIMRDRIIELTSFKSAIEKVTITKEQAHENAITINKFKNKF